MTIKIIGAALEISCSSWTNFKQFIDGTTKALDCYFCECANGYEIFSFEGTTVYRYFLWYTGTDRLGVSLVTNNANVDDFETNFKPTAIQV